jgi:hypothetical protein
MYKVSDIYPKESPPRLGLGQFVRNNDGTFLIATNEQHSRVALIDVYTGCQRGPAVGVGNIRLMTGYEVSQLLGDSDFTKWTVVSRMEVGHDLSVPF